VSRYKTFLGCGILSCFYIVLIHGIFMGHYRLDFSSFYSSSYALEVGKNPYEILVTHYLPVNKKLSVNLNPPFCTMALLPLSKLPYPMAVMIWTFGSLLLGALGTRIILKLLCPRKKNSQHLFYLGYFAFFPVIMNMFIGQLGAVIFYFIMKGYVDFVQKKDYQAGLFWGIVAALKIFPGLLLLFVCLRRRYRLAAVMLTVLILTGLLPWVVYGPKLYENYFSMMSHVLWYGDSWNASAYGYLFRLFADRNYHVVSLQWLNLGYLVFFLVSLLFYVCQFCLARSHDEPRAEHRLFAMTLVLMLVLSPFGWLYYFSLLTFPLLYTAQNELNTDNKSEHIMRWFVCLFLINFPVDCVKTYSMTFIYTKISLYSVHFYGLILLLYLTCKKPNNHDIQGRWLGALSTIFIFGLVVVIMNVMMR